MKETIELVLERIEELFRYVLPGTVVLFAGYASHPGWFASCSLSETRCIATLALLSVVVGALAYCLHRFSVHQVLDWVSWKLENVGAGYRTALLNAVQRGVPRSDINDFIGVRSAQLIFLFVSAEAFLLSTILPPEQGSIIHCHRCGVAIACVIVLLFACWQYLLLNDLDRKLERS